jgi:uncharacterized protein (TIGR00266 family)
MKYFIEGRLAQTVRLVLDRGESCWAGKGSLTCIDPGLRWSLKLPGGLGGAGRRLLSGEGVSLTYLESDRDGSEAVLSSNQPGRIMDWSLDQGAVLTTRGSFVGAVGETVEIDVRVARRARAAFFGGAGLFLQRISGRGLAFIHGAGDFLDYSLSPGQSILVSTGNLAAFSDEVDYDIQAVSGVRRILFSGEGLFMTRLTGPGRVLLQSLKRSSRAAPPRGE